MIAKWRGREVLTWPRKVSEAAGWVATPRLFADYPHVKGFLLWIAWDHKLPVQWQTVLEMREILATNGRTFAFALVLKEEIPAGVTTPAVPHLWPVTLPRDYLLPLGLTLE